MVDDFFLQKVRTFARRMDATQFVSHTTAAWMWRLPVRAPGLGDAVHIATTVPNPRPRRAGVMGHELEERLVDVVVHDGVRLADPVSCWAMLGQSLPVPELVAIADALLRGGAVFEPVARDQLERAVELRSGSRGASPLREALALARAGSVSRIESLVRVNLFAAGADGLEVGFEAETNEGTVRFALGDSFARLAVDLVESGSRPRLSVDEWMQRNRALAEQGWLVITIQDTQLVTDSVADWRALAARIAMLQLKRAHRERTATS